MFISATLQNEAHRLRSYVSTGDVTRPVNLPAKDTGWGSAVNGAELLLLSLATCFCNDLLREAARRSLAIRSVEVTVTATFAAEGEAGSDFRYRAHVDADAAPGEIEALIRQTDAVAEIHNTLRKGVKIHIE